MIGVRQTQRLPAKQPRPIKAWFALLVAAMLWPPLWAADGATLYAQNCAACHGDRGSGGIGVPLASANGLMSDDYLRKTQHIGGEAANAVVDPQLAVYGGYTGELASTLVDVPGVELCAVACRVRAV